MNVNLFAKFRCLINNLGKENRQTKKMENGNGFLL